MRNSLERSRLELLTLDCYGTLIDWAGGVRNAAAALESLRGCELDQLVHDREALDEIEVTRGYAPYGVKLGASLREAAARQGRELTYEDERRFIESMGSWAPFEETKPALERLGRLYQLAVLSNVETRVLYQSLQTIGVEVDFFVTAEQVRSYKPARAHFDAALERSKRDKSRILHVGASLFHDVRPALEYGWNVAWVNRDGRPGRSDAVPALEVRSLTELCEALRC
ncbi:MAG: HAD hydrolase-like protein [Planctomycetaceae bacterium]|nr:HAD hydrolase-like protein [Planctomycetaceae bacterium]